jgi:hypothetical protein
VFPSLPFDKKDLMPEARAPMNINTVHSPHPLSLPRMIQGMATSLDGGG